MDQHSDGINEEFGAIVQMATAQAALIIEEIARIRERHARLREAESAQRRVEDKRRMESELAAMRAQAQPVMREDWWRRATPERIGTTYELASGFEPYDPVAAAAAQRIREEVRDRWDVDVVAVAHEARYPKTVRETAAGKSADEMTPAERHVSYLDAQRFLSEADPELRERIGLRLLEANTVETSIAAQNEAIDARRRILDEQYAGQRTEQERAGQTPADVTVAAAEMAAAEAADRAAAERAAAVSERVEQLHVQADEARGARIQEEVAAEAAAAPAGYDTRERRTGTEHSLRAAGSDAEAVDARMLDDVSNALPPTSSTKRGRKPAARKTRTGQDVARELGDQGR